MRHHSPPNLCTPLHLLTRGVGLSTGYIGGSVLSRLLAHPEAKSFEFTALARSAEKAAKLNTVGVKTVLGSYSDLDLLTKSAKEADIVIAVVGFAHRFQRTSDADFMGCLKGRFR